MFSKNNKNRISAMALIAAATLTTGSTYAGTLNWTGLGATTDFTDLANWDATPTGGTIDITSLVDIYNIDIDGIIAGPGNLMFREGGGINMSAGTFTSAGGGFGLIEDPNSLGFLNLTGGTMSGSFFLAELTVTLGGTADLTLSGGGNPINISTVNFTSPDASLHFIAEDVAAFTAEHLTKFTTRGDAAIIGDNLSVVTDGANGSIITGLGDFGAPITKVFVNTTTGLVTLDNLTDQDITLDYYQVTSSSGSLNTGSWTSLADIDRDNTGPSDGSGNGWEELGNSSANKIGEAILSGDDTIAAGDRASLGALFTPGSDEDLVFTSRQDGSARLILVEYYAENAMPGISGADTDNIVNSQDLDAIIDNFGSNAINGDTQDENGITDGVVSLSDIFNVRNNFNNNYNPAAAIPEPSSLALLGLTIAGLIKRRK